MLFAILSYFYPEFFPLVKSKNCLKKFVNINKNPALTKAKFIVSCDNSAATAPRESCGLAPVPVLCQGDGTAERAPKMY
jgi:hypothetical protein